MFSLNESVFFGEARERKKNLLKISKKIKKKNKTDYHVAHANSFFIFPIFIYSSCSSVCNCPLSALHVCY